MTHRRMFLYGFAMVAFVLVSYRYFDLPIAEFFHLHQTFWIIEAASVLTCAGEGIYYIVPSLIAFAILRKRREETAQIALFIFTTAALSGLLVNVVKVVFARFRPKTYFEHHLYGFDWFSISPASYSFPSGHSVTAVGVWFAFALLLPKYRIPLIAIGVGIALTRILLTAHYLSDVIAGSAMGIAVTLAVHRAFVRNRRLRETAP